jgi:hypothetical protein
MLWDNNWTGTWYSMYRTSQWGGETDLAVEQARWIPFIGRGDTVSSRTKMI